MAYTRYSVNRLLHRDGVKLDQPTALYILSNDGLHVLQTFTRDPASIDAALSSHKAVLPWRLQGNFYRGVERINKSRSPAPARRATRTSYGSAPGCPSSAVWN
jgi:hypothetical protein